MSSLSRERNLTMRSSGLRGHTIVFPVVLSARSRLTRRWAAFPVAQQSSKASLCTAYVS
jgi:hypothetical protein